MSMAQKVALPAAVNRNEQPERGTCTLPATNTELEVLEYGPQVCHTSRGERGAAYNGGSFSKGSESRIAASSI